MCKTVFVVDIDGTVCDSIGRVVEMTGSKRPEEEGIWTDEIMKEFLKKENIMSDKVLPGSEIIFKMRDVMEADMIFLTGRSEFARDSTRLWLKKKLKIDDAIPLFMRPFDERKGFTALCKEKMFLDNVYEKGTKYIFFEDDVETGRKYSKFGLVLKSPECWKILNEIYGDE